MWLNVLDIKGERRNGVTYISVLSLTNSRDSWTVKPCCRIATSSPGQKFVRKGTCVLQHWTWDGATGRNARRKVAYFKYWTLVIKERRDNGHSRPARDTTQPQATPPSPHTHHRFVPPSLHSSLSWLPLHHNLLPASLWLFPLNTSAAGVNFTKVTMTTLYLLKWLTIWTLLPFLMILTVCFSSAVPAV